MTDQPEKLDLASHNLPTDKTAELLRLFPEIRTEGGKIDFDKLKLVLGQTIDVGRERYGMTWPGKADCFKTVQTPSMGTLLPIPNEGIEFDTTENLIIEGDNLEALKLLQKAYLGKVKMIYIDPPYNTGNDFIYPDNYSESMQTYLQYTGQSDTAGKKFSSNSDSDGRYHSKWLNMMYARLYLARNLMQENGLIFISIDDHEMENLRRVCDEIFGETSFVGVLTWITTTQPDNIGRARFGLQQNIEYVIVYSKCPSIELPPFILASNGQERKYPHQGRFGACRLEIIERAFDGAYARPTLIFPILGVMPREGKQWQIGEETAKDLVARGRIEIVDGLVKRAVYPEDEADEETGLIPFWSYLKQVGTSQSGKAELTKLLGNGNGFDTVKPVNLITEILSHLPNDSLVLDFFAGSGTTAHAVLEANSIDNGKRRFILIQLPAVLDTEIIQQRTSAQYLDGIGKPRNIAEITKERVRRVIKKLNDEEAGQLPIHGKQDRGFRVFKLAESNFKTWDSTAPKDGKALEKQLEIHIEHIRDGRTSEDILYEILLKSSFPLTTPVEKVEVAGKSAYSVAGGSMLICLEKELTLEAVRGMAEMKPQRVVCLDLGFAGNDQLKTNAVQIFKNKEIVFKTV
ncbi:MAG: site-specific DNA-methyltransferase [Chloroflexi bacterium]|nr:site-specific DNA-methyltransferase [Chloroflexota bacterium]